MEAEDKCPICSIRIPADQPHHRNVDDCMNAIAESADVVATDTLRTLLAEKAKRLNAAGKKTFG